MATIAESILAIVTLPDVSAVTLSGGYAVQGGNRYRTLFEPCRTVEVRHNRDGRCIYLRGAYRDGSGIVFTWNPARGARFRIAAE